MAIAIIRTLILYSVIVISMRIMGKRQIGELAPSEFVVAVLISEMAAHPLQDIGTPLIYGLVPVMVLVICEILISGLGIKSLKFRELVVGKPSLIIENGQISEFEMKKCRYTLDELAEQLRKKDILDISTVKYAVLETDGTLSTILYPAEAPLTPKQMSIQTDDISYPVIVISDGQILEKNLKRIGFNRAWLNKQLGNRKFKNAGEVFLMTADTSGRVYLAAREGA